MKLVRESIDSILKPKSQAEIKSHFDEMDTEELYHLWIDSGSKEYLPYLVERPDVQDFLDEENIADILYEYPEYGNKLLPSIITHLNDDFTISKTHNGYNIEFSDWSVFGPYLKTTAHMDLQSVEAILTGGAEDMFINTGWIDKIDDFAYSLSSFTDDGEELKKAMISEYEGDENIKDIHGIYPLIEFVADHEDDFDRVVDAIKNAFYETQSTADEYEAYTSITESITEEILLAKPEWINDRFIAATNEHKLIKLFMMGQDQYEKISLNIPYNGWQGDISKNEETFVDALNNQLDNYFHINEADSSDFLKPKSNDDIVKAFQDLNTSQRIEALENSDDYEDEPSGKKPNFRKLIPKKDWPLIITIKEEMKKDEKFDNNFRVTSTDPINYHTENVMTSIGAYFRVFSRNYPYLPFVSVEQLDHDNDNIRVCIKNSDNEKGKIKKIKTYKEFWDWMMKVGYNTYI